MDIRADLEQIRFFSGLSSEELGLLAKIGRRLKVPAKVMLFEEGESGFDIFIVCTGQAAVLKHSDTGEPYQISTLQAGDIFGEMGFMEEGIRVATVQTLVGSEVICIDGEALRSPEYAQIYAKLLVAVGTVLSERLKFTNAITVKSMQAELTALKSQVGMAMLIISVLFLSSLYEFTLGVAISMKETLTTTTPLSVTMILVYALTFLIVIWRGGYPLATYGLSWKHGWRDSGQALLYTIPILFIILLLKLALISHFPEYSAYPLFQPYAAMKSGSSTPFSAYVLTIMAYVVLCPVQEFIVRGVLQSSLEMFLRRNIAIPVLIAVVLSNLVFASSHMHTSFKFALLSFIPGLFWGWLYSKQHSLVGVSLSHILVGVWVSFIVGWPGLT